LTSNKAGGGIIRKHHKFLSNKGGNMSTRTVKERWAFLIVTGFFSAALFILALGGCA